MTRRSCFISSIAAQGLPRGYFSTLVYQEELDGWLDSLARYPQVRFRKVERDVLRVLATVDGEMQGGLSKGAALLYGVRQCQGSDLGVTKLMLLRAASIVLSLFRLTCAGFVFVVWSAGSSAFRMLATPNIAMGMIVSTGLFSRV